ncbi:tail fiber domain-containing protein [Rahnella sp. FC061912-K]|uniref:pyocin knob domain-containing S74 family peptidase n=1 Tax=Rahnella rivi TaxID=2816249 RepID=UPI001C25A346|nr:pyocin knob domain-containing S74 family peptidase [Rahnella rivi]MBU9830462.1 tail fiber domain-containing protein [Rahnella rivi]
MAWYKTGTVSVAATKVTGTGTNFLDAKFGVGPGQAFLLPASGTVKIYEIASVEDATHLTLTTSAGTVAAGAAYAVMSFYTDSIPDFSKRLAAQLGYYQSQMDGWQTIMTGTGTVSVTAPDGTVVNISSFAKLTSDMAKAYADGGLLNATVTPNSLGNVTDFNIYYQTANANAIIANGYPIAKAGTLYVTKSAYGCQQMYISFQGETYIRGLTGAFTPASPNWSDWVPQYGKIQVPLGSGVNGTLPIVNGGTGASTAAAARAALGAFSTAGGAVSGSLTAGAAAGLAVAAGENNRVEINNVTSGGGVGNPIGWTVYRWYTELAQTGIRRAGDTTIQSYFVALSGGGGWEFLRGGNATASGTWTSGSDERHKFDIEPVNNALAAVLTFRGATYGKKDGGREVGLIAQDVERACKEAITYNGDRKFSDGTVIPNFKYLNTSGASAAFHSEAIKTLFELVQLALDKPDDARTLIANIKAQSEIIKNTAIENEYPWKEAPPIFTVPSSEDYEESTT